VRAVSSAYATYIAALLIFMLFASLWVNLYRFDDKIQGAISSEYSRLDRLINCPTLSLAYMNGTLYLKVFTPRPIKIEYLIVEYENGSLVPVKLSKVVDSYELIPVIENYSGEHVKIGLILENGIIVYYNPLDDPAIPREISIALIRATM